MSGDGTPVFSPLVLEQEHLADLRTLLAELPKESPRGKVMVVTALLDEQLRRSIAGRLVTTPVTDKLTDGFNAPLGSFAARIMAAYALGIISEGEHHDLEIIRKVRNDFAHSMTAAFTDSSIRDRCALLRAAITLSPPTKVAPEAQFTSAATAIVLRLVNRPHYVSKYRLTYQQWAY